MNVLITGCSSGIGRATAEHLLGAGFYSATKFAIEAISDALRFEAAGFGVQVVVVEPGPIKSDFTGTANAAMAQRAPDAGPYDDFHAAVARSDAEADESAIAGSPEDVAKTIERALTARRPRPRYRVTAVARALPVLRAVLPDRGWDAFLRTQVKPPQAP